MRHLSAKEQLELSYAVTAILSESVNPQAAVTEIVALVASAFDFDAAGFWVVHELQAALRCVTFWSRDGANFPNFELVTRVRSLTFGQGLPGKSWESKAPVFMPNLSDIPRAMVAKIDGLRCGVAFPAFRLRRVFGVFEFLSRTDAEPEPETMNFFGNLGGQIGVFLEHYGITEKVSEDRGEVRLAAERSVDAVLTIDEQSNILFANSATLDVFGWRPEELVGEKLIKIIPEHLRRLHEAGLHRYSTTGVRKLDWSEVQLSALHKDGRYVPVFLAFGEFLRKGKRVFTGFARLRGD